MSCTEYPLPMSSGVRLTCAIALRFWDYTLGGYQVLKKWLSYRERSILGRGLTVDEVAHVRDTARRIAALLLLGPDLGANYAAVTTDPYPWAPPGTGGTL